GVGAIEDGIGLSAGEEDSAVVGVAGRQVVDDGVNDALRHLRTPGAVEEDRSHAINTTPQGGELGPELLNREGTHDGMSSLGTGAPEHLPYTPTPRRQAMMNLPPLTATVIGSWSFPGWYAKFCEDVGRNPELYGTDDRAEAVRDAVRLAV